MPKIAASELGIELYREPPVSREYTVTTEKRGVRRLLIGIAVAFLALFLVLPLVNVFYEALSMGLRVYFNAIADSDTRIVRTLRGS